MNTSKPRRVIKRAKKEQDRQRLMALRAELTMIYDDQPPVHWVKMNHHQTREVIENYHQAQGFRGVAP